MIVGKWSTDRPQHAVSAPFTTLTPITLENLGGLIRGLGLHEEIDFFLTTQVSVFPNESSSEIMTPALLAHFPLRHEQNSKVVNVAARKNIARAARVNGTKVEWHESADQ